MLHTSGTICHTSVMAITSAQVNLTVTITSSSLLLSATTLETSQEGKRYHNRGITMFMLLHLHWFALSHTESNNRNSFHHGFALPFAAIKEKFQIYQAQYNVSRCVSGPSP